MQHRAKQNLAQRFVRKFGALFPDCRPARRGGTPPYGRGMGWGLRSRSLRGDAWFGVLSCCFVPARIQGAAASPLSLGPMALFWRPAQDRPPAGDLAVVCAYRRAGMCLAAIKCGAGRWIASRGLAMHGFGWAWLVGGCGGQIAHPMEWGLVLYGLWWSEPRPTRRWMLRCARSHITRWCAVW